MGISAGVSPKGRDQQQWIESIYQATVERAKSKGIEMPGYAEFKKSGWLKLSHRPEPVVMLKAFRDDPLANPLATPSGKIEIHSEVVASFKYG